MREDRKTDKIAVHFVPQGSGGFCCDVQPQGVTGNVLHNIDREKFAEARKAEIETRVPPGGGQGNPSSMLRDLNELLLRLFDVDPIVRSAHQRMNPLDEGARSLAGSLLDSLIQLILAFAFACEGIVRADVFI